MRKLKLQMQITVDGFVAGLEGQQDWMTRSREEKLIKFRGDLTNSIDTILMGRKMTEGFVAYWEDVVKHPEGPEFSFAKIMVETPKIVFSKTQKSISGLNVTITNEDVVEVVNALKNKKGKDIIVYGGAGFVASLIENNLIDEYYLITNPTAIGDGLKIFKHRTHLQLVKTTTFKCGKVVNKFVPLK